MRSLRPDCAVVFFALTSQCEGIVRSLQPDCAVASGASERHSGNSVQGSSALSAEGLGLLKKRFGE